MTEQPGRPDYGLDAPGWVRRLLLGGGASTVLALAARWPGTPLPAGARHLLWLGVWLAVVGGLHVWSSRVGKLGAATRLLDGLELGGDETVLDVGCGHGLLLIGAAKRLPRGRAVGIDLWSQVDQADNHPAATLANAALERVAERVEVHDGDMRDMPFAGATFDAVVSSLAIHNVPGAAGRERALAEIVRVLKPGGRVALLDIAHTAAYAAELRRAGFEDVRRSRYLFAIIPPVRVVAGRKPGSPS